MAFHANQMSVHEILEMIFQNKRLFLISMLLGFLVALVIAERTEKWYESKADIQVVDLNANEPLLKGLGVSTTANHRFTMARTRLLAENRLREMVEKLVSTPDYHGSVPHLEAMPVEAAVASIKNTISVELRSGSINIRSERKNPREARAITDYLQKNLIQELRVSDQSRLEGTMRVLKDLLAGYTDQLDRFEERLRDFEEYHQLDVLDAEEGWLLKANALDATAETPKGLVARFVGLIERYSRNDVDLQALEAKRSTILRQITEEPEFRVQEVTTGQSEIHRQIEALLAEATVGLEKIRQDRTDEHPDVVEKMQEIARYKEKLEETEIPVVRQEQKIANPIRNALEMQAGTLEAEIKAREEEQKRILAQSRELQARIREIPQKELEKLRIRRELDIQEQMYKTIRLRYEQAQLTEKLEHGDDRQEFIVLSTASLNEKPVRPNSTFMCLMGTFVGMVIGFALCFIREFTDTSFRNLEDASRFLDLPVLGVIPAVSGASRRIINRRKSPAN